MPSSALSVRLMRESCQVPTWDFNLNLSKSIKRPISLYKTHYEIRRKMQQLCSPVIAGEVNAGDEVLAGRLLERALVHVELAEHALPGGRAVAREAVPAVHASAAVLARLRGALVDVGRAIRPGKTRRALALRDLAEFAAGRTVQTGVGCARIVDVLAVGPGKPIRTRALVLVGRGVLARAAVLARLAGAADVEVLIAQYAAPVRVADALPARAVAVAVLAAGIHHALVAQFAVPSVATLALAADVAVTVHGVATLLADSCKKEFSQITHIVSAQLAPESAFVVGIRNNFHQLFLTFMRVFF